MKRVLLPVGLLVCCATLAVACGDDVEVAPSSPDSGSGGQSNQADASGGSGGTSVHPTTDAGMCATLGTLCHDYDTGNGDLGDQCHDVGHEGDPEACAEIYDDCVAFCQEHDESDAGDGGHAHAGEACETLAMTCHDLDDGGNNLAHECHEIGHAGDAHACEEMLAVCVSYCDPANAGDAGASLCHELAEMCHPHEEGDAGSTDAGDAGEADAAAHEQMEACHQIGHDGDVRACAAAYTDCVTACGGGDAGH